METLAALKDRLRQDALRRRAAMDPLLRIEAGLTLAEHVAALELAPGRMVAGFWPIRDEIDPRPLMSALREQGHGLCLPVVSEPHLLFRVLERGATLQPAGFGTQAPGPDAEQVTPDVLLMPLAAFDSFGNRIGYGKGHYDKALAALERDRRRTCIGLAFEAQEVDRVPAEPHDRPLDGILTEAGFRRF